MIASWEQAVGASKGDYGIYAKSVSGQVIAHNVDTVVETMSVIKVPILFFLLEEAQKGRLSLRQKVAVHRSDVGKHGSGILQDFHLHAPVELYNLAVLMMELSDNVATNVCIRLLGRDKINEFIQRAGLKQTRLVADKLDFPSNYSIKTDEKVGLSTPHEMAQLIEDLVKGDILDAQYTKLAMRLLEHVQTSQFSRRIPYGSYKKFGSKTGSAAFDVEPLMVLNESGYIISKSGQTAFFSMFTTLPTGNRYPYSADSMAKVEFAKVSGKLYRALMEL